MSTVVICNQDQMGSGDPELGQRILRTFLQKLNAIEGLTAIVFYNGGVRLVGPGSPVLAELSTLDEQGIDLLPCGTCLERFAITPAVGKSSDMVSIVREIARAAKVITL